ncbi:MAG: hypothetical protein PWP46_228 [Fusobacteriaceae bacterium]|jgi:predicted NBD/HSP70 family sugar kinase|nr:hypothetical protein [Fusobacteriales bacterium]MDN5303349.1 hypothetical protein [Fusobacteriaceae bacterium]
MQKVGNQAYAKQRNKKLIVDILRKEGPLSRADIKKFINLSSPSISTNVERLLNDNILVTFGRASSMGGRKTTFYNVNYNYGYIIGIDLSLDYIYIGISDLNGKILINKRIEVISKKYKTNFENLINNIYSLLDENGISSEKILYICISSPGVLKENGELKYVDSKDWFYESTLFNDLENLFDKKVFVENDVNLAVFAEFKRGVGKSFSYLSYIKIDKGLGAGIIFDGQILKGKNGEVGEVGFSLLRNKSGNIISLEEELNLERIYNEIREEIKSGQNTIIKELVNGHLENIDIDIIAKAITLNDEYTKNKVKYFAEELGIFISNIMSILSLESIIIGGSIKKLGKYFLDEVRKFVSENLPFEVTLLYSNFDDETGLIGAFEMGIDYFFYNLFKE